MTFQGDRQIGLSSGAIQFDVLTIDADGSSLSLTCNWQCAVQDGGFCYSRINIVYLIFSGLSGCTIHVQSNHFSAGETYTIRLVLPREKNKLLIILDDFSTR